MSEPQLGRRVCIPFAKQGCDALEVLASGCCFQDVASFSLTSRTTAETSFHHFCEKFSEGLWDTWVKLLRGDSLKKVEEIYRKYGYPGATGSTDCTHFRWPGCPFSEKNTHTCKEDLPGVIARDKSIWRIRDEEPWKSYKFKLYNADGTETEYTGAWIIVDGGYPKSIWRIRDEEPWKSYKFKLYNADGTETEYTGA
ncbi:unnamed protein product [Ectocarpus sp. CCAP 1310/34]|nr:unnamed protein product [Ectocarpus sp. CCAP 1310/34]